MAGTRLDIGGAGEREPSFLRNGLRFRGETSVQVHHPASVGPVNLTPNPLDWQESMTESVEKGYLELVFQITKLNRVGIVPALAGYSLGASILNRLLVARASGLHSGIDYAWSLTVGSPHAPLDRKSEGGIVGPHGAYPSDRPHLELRAPNDIICQTPKHSVLRSIPYFEGAVAAGLPRKQRDAYRRLAFEYLFGYGLIPSMRDWQLIAEYVNGRGHNEDYSKFNIFQAARVLP